MSVALCIPPAVILCGGQSRRMAAAFGTGSHDKALLTVAGRPMLGHVIARLRPQAGPLVLNANGDPGRFTKFGLPVVADDLPDFQGPLAGLLAGLRWARSALPDVSHVLSVSGDSPFLPEDLVLRLQTAINGAPDRAAIAASLGREHPIIGLWPLEAADRLAALLATGERRAMAWARHLGATAVPFDPIILRGRPVDPFLNMNTPEDLESVREIALSSARAVIGLAGWKNAGKTTLAVKLIEEFTRRGLRIASIKHTHHATATLEPTSDSARHAAAGARPAVLIGPAFWTLDGVEQLGPPPTLAGALTLMPPADLILVEGFRHAAIPKIEVRRSTARSPGEPTLQDDHIIAVASDTAVAEDGTRARARFDLDDVAGLANFIANALSLRA